MNNSPIICRTVLCLIASFLILFPGGAFAEKRLALIIGNSNYTIAPKLPNPKNDANDIALKLEELGFETVTGIDVTLKEMNKTIQAFLKKLTDADVAVFYYAGHGLQVQGRNYLVPIDAKLETSVDLDFETLPIDFVISRMERIVRTNIIFLDACRNNPLARNLARSMGQNSQSVGRGLAQIGSGVGTLIAFATQPGNVALDGVGRNSPYTKALLNHLATPGEDISRVLIRVRNQVLRETKGKQVPWENSSLTGAIVLRKQDPSNHASQPKLEEQTLQKLREIESLKLSLLEKEAKQKAQLDRSQSELEKVQREVQRLQAEQDKITKLSSLDNSSEIAKNLSSEENFRLGMQLYERKSFSRSALHLGRSAEGGNVEGMVEYANLLENGVGLTKNEKLSHEWFVKAAAKKSPQAIFRVGRNFERGQAGLKKNPVLALEHYTEAANLNNADAMNNIGVLHMLGEGVRVNMKLAADWFKKGAKAGNANAMFNLSALQDGGQGTGKNPKAAALSVMQAIVLGNKHAKLEMKNNSSAWSTQFRKEFQILLKARNLYKGKIDGKFGTGTSQAIDKISNS